MDYQGRQRRLREVLSQHRLDALLISHLPNIRYLCGFTGSAGSLLVTKAGTVFFTDGRYTAQSRAEVEGARVVIARKAPLIATAEWLATNRGRFTGRKPCKIAVEAEHLTVATGGRLAKALPRAFRLQATSLLVERGRMIKDSEEIARIRKAVLLGSSLFDHMLRAIRPGTKEMDVAAELEYSARKAGAQEISFPTIIAGGKRSALPHGRASAAVIPSRGFVVCDYGVILAGYCSDMTRTVHVGRPPGEARRLYHVVREAQAAALAVVGPGIGIAKVDAAARKVLRKEGLAEYFTHSTGHGVGLEIHEAPRVAAGEKEVLRPGMVITIEPGAYIPGQWGVRIEDMVAVTERGCEVLTPTRKELIVI
jgi:Xaa-Pro aminopeptidase